MFLEGQFRFQNDHVLGPDDGHGLSQHLWGILIGSIKIPHPAKVSGGEVRDIRIGFAEVFSGGNSGTFLWPGADKSANFAIQFHLRQFSRYSSIQLLIKGTVVYGLPNVHLSSLLSGAGASVFVVVSEPSELLANLTLRWYDPYGQTCAHRCPALDERLLAGRVENLTGQQSVMRCIRIDHAAVVGAQTDCRFP